MKRTADQLDRMILRALCEDLTPFECMVNNMREFLEAEELEQLATRLLGLATLRLVDAYLLHAEPPYLTPVTTDSDGVYRHWFFISEEGLKRLHQLGPQPERDDDWPRPPSRDHHARHRRTPRQGR